MWCVAFEKRELANPAEACAIVFDEGRGQGAGRKIKRASVPRSPAQPLCQQPDREAVQGA